MISQRVRIAPGSLADSSGGHILSHAGGKFKIGSAFEIDILQAGLLSLCDALAWQIQAGQKLESIMDSFGNNLTQREKAVLAVKVKNELITAARNAMQDGNAALQLGVMHPPRTLDEMLCFRGEKYSGDALYKQVIKDAGAELRNQRKGPKFDSDGCFVAGTLVHTKHGLVPIEQIKVGDWVLSKPDSGEGEVTYKRVVDTFEFDDKEIWYVEYSYYGMDRPEIDIEGGF